MKWERVPPKQRALLMQEVGLVLRGYRSVAGQARTVSRVCDFGVRVGITGRENPWVAPVALPLARVIRDLAPFAAGGIRRRRADLDKRNAGLKEILSGIQFND